MQFELTEALLDDIIFSMEDQEGEYFIDCQDGVVINNEESWDLSREEPSEADEGRFISLPHWDSSSGFRLMERFAASFRNPLIRDELSSALNQGRGVFRAFKNVLSLHPEAEKLWFSYKEREMKWDVIRWYNGLREEWGMEKIGLEPEETEDLVLEDFRFREFREEDQSAVDELHRFCTEESAETFLPNGYCAKADAGNGDPFFVAESGHGDFAGYISACREGDKLYINALEVKAEYRGLGIGKALLDLILEKTETSGVSMVFLDLPANWDGFSRVLVRKGFAPIKTLYGLEIKNEGNCF